MSHEQHTQIQMKLKSWKMYAIFPLRCANTEAPGSPFFWCLLIKSYFWWKSNILLLSWQCRAYFVPALPLESFSMRPALTCLWIPPYVEFHEPHTHTRTKMYTDTHIHAHSDTSPASLASDMSPYCNTVLGFPLAMDSQSTIQLHPSQIQP